MTPKHSIEAISAEQTSENIATTMAELTAKITPTVHAAEGIHNHNPKHQKQHIAENDVIHIVKGNPNPQEIAVLTSIFTVLATRDKALRVATDNWPSPHPDAAMRGPFGTFTRYRTNLRWW